MTIQERSALAMKIAEILEAEIPKEDLRHESSVVLGITGYFMVSPRDHNPAGVASYALGQIKTD